MSNDSEGKSGNRKPQILKGFRDYLPEHMRLRQQIIGKFRAVFESHGFEPLDTPVLEYLEVLTGKAGENEKLMYGFEDHGGRKIGLRYDLTVPLARVVAMHQAHIPLPFKRYHIAPVWRAEKPQRGRFREFWQCDADIAGAPSALADAEILAILGESLDAVGLPNYTIQVSHRQLLARVAVWAGIEEGLAGQVYRSVDKLAKIGPDAVVAEMVEGGVEQPAAAKALRLLVEASASDDALGFIRDSLGDDPVADTALAELQEIFEVLPSMGITGKAVFDPTLARGLDYYTGPVFEAVVEEPRIGSVAGGGRYEDLIGSFANRTITATGVSLGLERIIEVVREFDLLPGDGGSADVLVVTMPGAAAYAASVASQFRQAGFRTELSSQPNRSVGDQLKYGSKKGIRFAVIGGEAERESQQVALKDLESGEQRTMSVHEVIQSLQQAE
ncbi:MAG: histidine--tRNA ligase [Thermomicrobiales bacterium]|nr:histidine--tRNA ligase [Thermomicrobiales bacterium]